MPFILTDCFENQSFVDCSENGHRNLKINNAKHEESEKCLILGGGRLFDEGLTHKIFKSSPIGDTTYARLPSLECIQMRFKNSFEIQANFIIIRWPKMNYRTSAKS